MPIWRRSSAHLLPLAAEGKTEAPETVVWKPHLSSVRRRQASRRAARAHWPPPTGWTLPTRGRTPDPAVVAILMVDNYEDPMKATPEGSARCGPCAGGKAEPVVRRQRGMMLKYDRPLLLCVRGEELLRLCQACFRRADAVREVVPEGVGRHLCPSARAVLTASRPCSKKRLRGAGMALSRGGEV